MRSELCSKAVNSTNPPNRAGRTSPDAVGISRIHAGEDVKKKGIKMTFYVLDINQEVIDFQVNPEEEDIFVEFDYSLLERKETDDAESN